MSQMPTVRYYRNLETGKYKYSAFLKPYLKRICLYCGKGRPEHNSVQYEMAICTHCVNKISLNPKTALMLK